MRRPERIGTARRLSLLACTLTALAALPADKFPIQWIASFAVPAGIVLPLLERTRLRRLHVFGITAVVQLGAILALAGVLPLGGLAALGCTLIPPAVYAAVRAWPTDALRGVFLSFCLLLVAAILGNPPNAVVLGFLAAGILALAIDVSTLERERPVSWRGRTEPRSRRFANVLQLTSTALVVCLLTFRGLEALPDPVRPIAPAAGADASGNDPSRTAGPARDFEFDGSQGSPLALRADHLITATALDGRPIPADLYLRSGAFERAGLDRWSEGRSRLRPLRSPGYVGSEFTDLAERRVRVVSAVATDLAFVPAGTFAIEAATALRADVARATFRFAREEVGASFIARFHNLHLAELDRLPDPSQIDLLFVPDEVERYRALFEPILRDPRVKHAVEPLRVAEAVGAVLQDLCTYALVEPAGRHGHSILNFLDGDHRGFCMHFASTTALALRMLGVPCRIGVGVYGGDPTDTTPLERTYGSHHAHAWVELPLERAGWVVYDPTPPSVREFLRWPELADQNPAMGDPAAVDLQDPGARPLEQLFDPTLLGIVIVALLFFGVAFRGADRRSERAPTIAPTHDVREVRRLMAKILKAHADAGRWRVRGEGLESWQRRIAPDDDVLRAAITAFQEVRFGARGLDEARRSALVAAADLD